MIKTMNKIFSLISTTISLFMLVIILLVNSLLEGTSFSGIDILIIISILLMNPIINLLKINRKIINNFVYHILLISVALYNIYIYVIIV